MAVPAACPPAARFARKYHYHRYLSSLSASSKLAAVPKNNTHVSFRVSVACRSPYDNGKVSAQGYSVVLVLYHSIFSVSIAPLFYLLTAMQILIDKSGYNDKNYPLNYKTQEMRFGQEKLLIIFCIYRIPKR